MSRYLLPCSCGKKHSVAAPQAGGSLACDCGQTITIPGLRELKLLPPDKAAAEPGPAHATTNAVDLLGLVFGVSLLLFLGGGAVAAYCGYVITQIDTKDYSELELEHDLNGLESMPADRLFNLWKKVTAEPLQFETPHHVYAREASRKYWNYTSVAGVLAAIGLAGTIYSVVAGGKPKQR